MIICQIKDLDESNRDEPRQRSPDGITGSYGGYYAFEFCIKKNRGYYEFNSVRPITKRRVIRETYTVPSEEINLLGEYNV